MNILKIAICICTYNRYNLLIECLNSIQQLNVTTPYKIDLKIIVVDNNDDLSDLNKLKGYKSHFPLILGHETKKGIPYARNSSVKLAGEVDYYAFIDDDETADKEWLQELLKTLKKYNASVTQGNVIFDFEKGPSKWMRKFFDIQNKKEGQVVKNMATNCTLVSSNFITNIKGPFETRLAQTGGSDTFLGHIILKKGGAIIASEKALVFEFTPAHRTTFRWIMQRVTDMGIIQH